MRKLQCEIKIRTRSSRYEDKKNLPETEEVFYLFFALSAFIIEVCISQICACPTF